MDVDAACTEQETDGGVGTCAGIGVGATLHTSAAVNQQKAEQGVK